jgi:hypothetical protein
MVSQLVLGTREILREHRRKGIRSLAMAPKKKATGESLTSGRDKEVTALPTNLNQLYLMSLYEDDMLPFFLRSFHNLW